MASTDLLVICAAAFLTVFVILMVLAIIMRLIIIVFPEKEDGFDAAILSVMASTYQTIYPNTKITKIEEVK